jgi:hypothetical protein
MKKLFALICIITSALLLTECKKYPEGPSISLRSKNERIANTWKLSKYYENSVDLTSNFNTTFTKFAFNTTKGGDYTITRELYSIANTTESGTWTLSSNKKTFNLSPTSITIGAVPNASSWQILKLYENEMWLRNIDSNGKIIEYHLVSA